MYPDIKPIKSTKTPAAKVLTNAGICFTVYGKVQIVSIVSDCTATGTPAATTLQWQSAPTVGVAATFTGSSGSLATAVAGSSVTVLAGQTTAPSLVVSGANNVDANSLAIVCPTGTIKSVVGTGPSTGTWIHYMNYIPLEAGAYVVAS